MQPNVVVVVVVLAVVVVVVVVVVDVAVGQRQQAKQPPGRLVSSLRCAVPPGQPTLAARQHQPVSKPE